VLRVPVRGGRGHRVAAPHRLRPPGHSRRVPPPAVPRAPALAADRHLLRPVVRAEVPRPRQRARRRHVRGPHLTLRLLFDRSCACLLFDRITGRAFWFTDDLVLVQLRAAQLRRILLELGPVRIISQCLLVHVCVPYDITVSVYMT
jgi:hypothetical protein